MSFRPHIAALGGACLLLLCSAQVQPQSAATADTLTQYAGMYRSADNQASVHAVYVDAGVLYEESEQRARQPLTADPDSASADRFKLDSPVAHVIFVRGASGNVIGLKVVLDGDHQLVAEEQRFSESPVRLNRYREYSREQVMIPMRDKARLHAIILRPAQMPAGESLPFLLVRTPYGVNDSESASINRSKPELAASGYVFVFEDVRGRYGSEGKFVMNRPVVEHLRENDVDETTDAYDTVDWLLKNVHGNNGRVGVYGISYDGFLATMAGVNAHPAVKAISPQAPMTDVWMGDDFFHNGAFRQSYSFDYIQQMEGQKVDARVDSKEDTYDFFLQHGNFAGAAAAAHMEKLPTAKAFLQHPEYADFWRAMAVQNRMGQVTVPTLEVGGYWDQEDMWGTQEQYAELQRREGHGGPPVYLILGPWNHGGWTGMGSMLGSEFGRIELGEPTGEEFRKTMEFPFFERYLKDHAGFDLMHTASFRTGANRWERYSAWPPENGVTLTPLYLAAGKQLSFTPPVGHGGDEIAARYVSDPETPVPYRHRPVQSTYGAESRWYTWLVEDQRFVAQRQDVAMFRTPILDKDVTVAGDVTAKLFAATTGTDGDWVVKLIDVAPSDDGEGDGYELMIAEEIFRGRYRKSFEKAEALTPNEVAEYRFSLHAADHTFLKGHRIMVQVQSTWFPLYDRNPQTFVPNIMTAPSGAYRPETVTIYGSERYPSAVVVPIISGN